MHGGSVSHKSASEMMRAAVAEAYGAASSVLTVIDMPVPRISGDQMLVRVHATSVNPADAKQRSGNLKLVMKHRFPLVLGQDFAGVVESIGEKVKEFKVGDEVYGCTAPRNGCSAPLSTSPLINMPSTTRATATSTLFLRPRSAGCADFCFATGLPQPALMLRRCSQSRSNPSND